MTGDPGNVPEPVARSIRETPRINLINRRRLPPLQRRMFAVFRQSDGRRRQDAGAGQRRAPFPDECPHKSFQHHLTDLLAYVCIILYRLPLFLQQKGFQAKSSEALIIPAERRSRPYCTSYISSKEIILTSFRLCPSAPALTKNPYRAQFIPAP